MRKTRLRSLLASAGLIAALTACETIEEEATEALGREFVATLAPAAGGSGSGRAEIALNDAENRVCTDLELSSGVQMTAGRIVGPGNTTVVTLDVPNVNNDADDCDDLSDAVLDGIKANPGAYSVQITAATGNLSGVLKPQV